MAFQIIRNDITKVKADAIVNTANPEVAIGDGVDFAIYRAAGEEALFLARQKIGRLAPGEAAVTDAFGLSARCIIHVCGPRWRGGGFGEEALLRQCYDRALRLALEQGCASIAFPLLSTGTYGFPKMTGVQIAVDAFTDFLKQDELEITLAVFGSDSVKISGQLVDEVSAFVDDEYVERAVAREYRGQMPSPHIGEGRHQSRDAGMVGRLAARLGASPRAKRSGKHAADMAPSAAAMSAPVEALARRESPGVDEESVLAEDAAPVSLDEAIGEIYTDSFENHLKQLLNKKGLRNAEVYAAANISKQYFSKLLKGKVKPSKEKMLALAVGLRLNLDEAVDFLRIGGYAFSPISQTDVVVKYFLRKGDYNVMKIDIVLFDYGLDPLSNRSA